MELGKNKMAARRCPQSLTEGTFPTRSLEPNNPGKDFFTPAQWRAIGQTLDLSERELEVTVLIVEGYSRDEIAARLRKADGTRLSAQTVRVYIERIFQKARVQDRLELALRLARICREIDVASLGITAAANPKESHRTTAE